MDGLDTESSSGRRRDRAAVGSRQVRGSQLFAGTYANMGVCQRLLCFAAKELRGSARTKLACGGPVSCFGSVLGELRRDVKRPAGNPCKTSLIAGDGYCHGKTRLVRANVGTVRCWLPDHSGLIFTDVSGNGQTLSTARQD